MIPVLVANQFRTFAIDRMGSCWNRANHARTPTGGFEPNAASIA